MNKTSPQAYISHFFFSIDKANTTLDNEYIINKAGGVHFEKTTYFYPSVLLFNLCIPPDFLQQIKISTVPKGRRAQRLHSNSSDSPGGGYVSLAG